MTAQMSAYLDATARCAEQCEAMVQSEQEKRRALLGGADGRLEQVLQEQQAAVMHLEMLERKRLAAQVEAGFPERAAGTEILSSLPEGEERDALTALLERLRLAAGELRELNHTALEIAQMQLQALGRSVQPATYRPGPAQGREWGGEASFEQKI